MQLETLVQSEFVSPFIKEVFKAEKGERIVLNSVTCKHSFLRFLEFLYCDKFASLMTVDEIRGVADICNSLNLKQSYAHLKKMTEYGQHKLQNQVFKEMNDYLHEEQ